MRKFYNEASEWINKAKKEPPQINSTLKSIVSKMSKKYTSAMKPEVKKQFEIDMANALLEAIEPYDRPRFNGTRWD